jgi:hypothetical protein
MNVAWTPSWRFAVEKVVSELVRLTTNEDLTREGGK